LFCIYFLLCFSSLLHPSSIHIDPIDHIISSVIELIIIINICRRHDLDAIALLLHDDHQHNHHSTWVRFWTCLTSSINPTMKNKRKLLAAAAEGTKKITAFFPNKDKTNSNDTDLSSTTWSSSSSSSLRSSSSSSSSLRS
jgi:hypothetical protein